MLVLKGTRVQRGGVTARRWYETIPFVRLTAATELQISFSIDSKGGGQTQLQLEIGPEDFPTLVEAMSLVDRQAAMQAMAAELSRQIATQPERNQRLLRRTESKTGQRIVELARQKYQNKPVGEDERERIVLDGVSELLAELKIS